MLCDLLSSRAIQWGLSFFLLVVGSSLLYNWHVRCVTERQLGGSDVLLQSSENQNEARSAAVPVDTSPVTFEKAEPHETDTAEVIADGTAFGNDAAAPIDLSDAFVSDDFVSESESVEDVGVSPHGFGAYPEVPLGYPVDLMPTWITKNGEQSQDHELLDRVLIELWNQGDKKVSGAFMTHGRVYPLYPDAAYVEYESFDLPDGSTYKIMTGVSGPSGVGIEYPTDGSPPRLSGGYSPIDIKNAGIDPYNFLILE